MLMKYIVIFYWFYFFEIKIYCSDFGNEFVLVMDVLF